MKVVFFISLFFINTFIQDKSLNIEPEKVYNLKLENDSNIILLDVINLEEVLQNNIKNSLNINYYSENFNESINKLDKEKIYYVYCRSGRRSMNTVLLMRELGFQNSYNIDGGILKWMELELPLK